ncbi:hypothetical protein BX666DRAFT_1911658 [Dichotomocladium elegans]|nr:hypothetical protein BX666DRAFT_1911658 [Dichotomocladium elegans]
MLYKLDLSTIFVLIWYAIVLCGPLLGLARLCVDFSSGGANSKSHAERMLPMSFSSF